MRFRYRLKEAATIRFQLANLTQQEQFAIDVDGVAGAWTTVTVPVVDIAVVPGGRKAATAAGDRFGRFGWYVKSGDLLIDDFRVVEIERPK